MGRVSGGCVRRGARFACAQCWAPWVRPVTPLRVSAAAGQVTQGTSATSVPGVTLRNLVSPLICTYVVDADCRRTCLFRSDPNHKFLKVLRVRIKGEAHKE